MMLEGFYFGNLFVKMNWIYLLFAYILTYLGVSILFRKSDKTFKYWLDLYTNATAFMLIFYKFSIVIFRPTILWDNPLGLLYFTGGKSGIIIGLVIAIVYLIIKTIAYPKRKLLLYIHFIGIITFIVGYFMISFFISHLIG
jgi:hypothetical protein